MRERDLYPHVRDWLASRGYEIHVEIFDADIVAIKDGRLTAIELKLCLSGELITQCHHRARWADFVFAAIGSHPRITSGLRYSGIGLLLVDGGKVRQKIKPKPQPWAWHKSRAYRLKKLAGRAPAMIHETAGLPSCRELRQQRQARELAELLNQ